MPSPPLAAPPIGDDGLHAMGGLRHIDATFTAAGTINLLDAAGDVRALEQIEAEAIRFALTHYRGQMSEVARKLQIGRSTLYRKLDSLGLAHSEGEAASNHDVAAK
jgi:DNA-binding NtrC family response regulator